MHRVRDKGIRPERFNHRMASFNDFQDIVICELWPNIIVLRGYQRETDQTVSSGKLVDRITKNTVIFLGDFFQERTKRFVGFALNENGNLVSR